MKYDLKDLSFIIALRIKDNERLNNINITVNYLLKNFNTNIIIVEASDLSCKSQFEFDIEAITHVFIKDENPTFNRSKYFNIGLTHVITPVLVLYDCDILLPIESYILGRNKILEGFDMFLPFSDLFYNINYENKKLINETLDLNTIKINEYDRPGCGGACFMNAEIYKYLGGDDENIAGWGPDDIDRIYCMKKFGLKISNLDIHHYEDDLIDLDNQKLRRFGFFSKLETKFPMYHLSHPIQSQKKETNINNWKFFYKKIKLPSEKFNYYHYLKSKFKSQDGINYDNFILYKNWLSEYKVRKNIKFN